MEEQGSDGEKKSFHVTRFSFHVTIITTRLFSPQELMDRKFVTLYDGCRWKRCQTTSWDHFPAQFEPVRGASHGISLIGHGQSLGGVQNNIRNSLKALISLTNDQNVHYKEDVDDEAELSKIHPQDVGRLLLIVRAQHDQAESVLIHYTDDHVENIVGRVDEWIDEMLDRAFSTRK